MFSTSSNTTPSSKNASSNHIRPLPQHDAAVLCACTEFPTFADALAKVLQVALPELEREAWRAFRKENELHTPSPTQIQHLKVGTSIQAPHLQASSFQSSLFGGKDNADNKRSNNINADPIYGLSSVEVSVSLPAFAWDISRRTEQSCSGKGKASLLIQKIELPVALVKSSSLNALNLFRRLAAICREVTVSVWLEVADDNCVDHFRKEGVAETLKRTNAGGQPRPLQISLCPEVRWECGQQVSTTPDNARCSALRRGGARAQRCTIHSQCCVRGLFENLPLRQAAFGMRSNVQKSSLTASQPSWALTSASAQRTRRDVQQHLFTVLFQTALCTVLAPLYLQRQESNSHEDRHDAEGRSTFAAHLYGELVDRMDDLPSHEIRGIRRLIRCGGAAGAQTDDVLSAHPAHAGTIDGLACDRFGLRSGVLRVSQARSKETKDVRVTTARELCDAFGVLRQMKDFAMPSETRQKRCSSQLGSWPYQKNARREVENAELLGGEAPELMEVVVRPGKFSVLFLQPAPSSVATTRPVVCESPHFPLRFPPPDAEAKICERQGVVSSCFLIVVGCSDAPPSGAASAPSSVACLTEMPFCRILEPNHWAYDVVTACSRRQRGSRVLSAARAVPLFLFVDASYVPAHRYQAQQRKRSRTDTEQQTELDISDDVSFQQLYAEAVERFFDAQEQQTAPFAPTATTDASVHPCQEGEMEASLAVPDKSPMFVPTDKNRETPVHRASVCEQSSGDDRAASVSFPSGEPSSEVGLRMQYICQRVLAAAAAPGTESYLPPFSPRTSACANVDSGSSCGRNGENERGPSTVSLHRVRLPPSALLLHATGHSSAGDGSRAVVALPRRTPVTLHPTLADVLKEEAEALSPPKAGATGTASMTDVAEGMGRMRQLLDTGRGSVLRQLPRACNPPRSWKPPAAATPLRSAKASPPIGRKRLAQVAVVPWARKFIVLVDLKQKLPLLEDDSINHSTSFTALPAPLVFHPHQHRWWVLEQHAVHERLRLEFFLCFADTYVRHPELPIVDSPRLRCVTGRKMSPSPRWQSSPSWSAEAQSAVHRRHRHGQLLAQMRKERNRGEMRSPPYPSSLAFPVVIPLDWRARVSAVEEMLCQWGWRFAHEPACASQNGASPHCAALTVASVVSWPCVVVENVEHRVTTLQALVETVEELEAVGGPSAGTASSSLFPSAVIPSVFLRFFVSRSCRGAVMFGDAVKASAARQMVAALECVEQFYVCSHGRPSFATLDPLFNT